MTMKQRLDAVEAAHRRRYGLAHHVSVVSYPWNLPYGDLDRWLREALPCRCGEVGCPHLTIGMGAPAKAPSADAWSASVQHYYQARDATEHNRP